MALGMATAHRTTRATSTLISRLGVQLAPRTSIAAMLTSACHPPVPRHYQIRGEPNTNHHQHKSTADPIYRRPATKRKRTTCLPYSNNRSLTLSR